MGQYATSPSYRHVLTNKFVVEGNLVYLWRSSWLSAPMDPNLVNPAYGQLNLDGGISTPDGKYRLGFYARNALNTFYTGERQAGNGGYTNVLNYEAVRTVGMSCDMKFQWPTIDLRGAACSSRRRLAPPVSNTSTNG